jgi:hypothetical protein
MEEALLIKVCGLCKGLGEMFIARLIWSAAPVRGSDGKRYLLD